MKNLLPIAAALLISSCMATAQPGTNADSTSVSTALTADSSRLDKADMIITGDGDTVTAAAATLPARLICTDEGDSYILADGKAYPLQDVVDLFDNATRDFSENIAEQKLGEIGTWGIIGILALCFGIPALVVIVALVLIIGFFRKRNRERNAIIAKAIDHDYPLPDSFFSNQPHDQAETGNIPPTQARRNPQKFASAIKLIAVGLCVALFFCAIDTPFGIIAGGIPLLLGVGQLIGYLYVPGYGAHTTTRHNGDGGNNGHAYPPPPPGERFYYDPRDPRYNR